MQPAAHTQSFYVKHLQKYLEDSPVMSYMSLVEWIPGTGIVVKGPGESFTLETIYKPELSKLVLSNMSVRVQDSSNEEMVTGNLKKDPPLDNLTDITSQEQNYCIVMIKNINSEAKLTFQVIAQEND